MITYLDHAATTFQKPESVYRTMDQANRHFSVNAGRGSYALARLAAEKIEETRTLLREVTGAEQMAEVVFTASATLAFNAVIGGMEWKETDMVYVSPYEHNAVVRTLHGYRKQYHFQVQELPLEENNAIDLQKTAYLFAKRPPTHLFLNLVSNVTGYVLPAAQLCREAAAYNCITVLDGAQALGTFPVHLKEYHADFFVFAGHKALCGPFGTGGYISLKEQRLKHLFLGGTGTNSLEPEMPEEIGGWEPGSPNIVAIAGLNAALREIRSPEIRQQIWERERFLICRLIEDLKDIPGIRLYRAPEKWMQAGIISLNLEGYLSSDAGRILDEEFEIAVRTGYHCAPLIHKYLRDQDFAGTVRISIGRYTEEEELWKVQQAFLELAKG